MRKKAPLYILKKAGEKFLLYGQVTRCSSVQFTMSTNILSLGRKFLLSKVIFYHLNKNQDLIPSCLDFKCLMTDCCVDLKSHCSQEYLIPLFSMCVYKLLLCDTV